MNHLHLVPPAKSPFPFEMQLFAFAKIGDDIFVCVDGKWTLARHSVEFAESLGRWTAMVASDVPDEPSPLKWPLQSPTGPEAA